MEAFVSVSLAGIAGEGKENYLKIKGLMPHYPPGGAGCTMRTLMAQRLKKQAEYEYRHRCQQLEQIFWEAAVEMEKLESLLPESGDMIIWEVSQPIYEEYREDDEAVYFEQGMIER